MLAAWFLNQAFLVLSFVLPWGVELMIDFFPELKRHHCHVAASYAVAVTVLP